MKSRIFSLAIAGLLVLLGSTVWLGAKNASAKKSDAPRGKMPVLKTDASPVGENSRPGLVTTYADVLDAVRPAVVSVYSTTIIQQRTLARFGAIIIEGQPQATPVQGIGSGVIISPDGYILTNNHVIADADSIEVALSDNRKLPAKIVGRDPRTDIAVIKIEGENLPAATLADSDKLRVGDIVFAIGNPLDVGQTVTMGIVSATGRKVGILDEVQGYEDFIQTDAAINQGNSGGALIDAKGRLVGINSALKSNNSAGNIGIGFAIPMKMASSIMRSLIEKGTVTRGYLGVNTQPLTTEIAEAFGLKPDTKGLVVTYLNPADGPAAKAGLKRGDVITGVDNRPVTSIDDLKLLIGELAPDTKVSVKILRDGKPQSIEATLGTSSSDGPDAKDNELIEGVTAAPLTAEQRRDMRLDAGIDGLLVTEVADDSPYRKILAEGNVIMEINTIKVTDMDKALNTIRPGRNLALVYARGSMRYIQFEIKGK